MGNIITAQNITKRFTEHTALDNVSVEIPAGSVYGLLGPNGAGKTTLIRVINRITVPDEGRILFEDYGNDCYKRFSFEDGSLPYNYVPHETDLEYNYQREREITIYNYAIAVLEKHFPNHKEVLIDLTW